MAPGNSRIAVEFAKCAVDAAYFCNTYGIIDDTQGHGDGSGTIPFHLWPSQFRVMWALMTDRLVLILKARQLGISWLCCVYALWHCLFGTQKVVILLSQGELEAKELLRRIKVVYERLPEWLLEMLPSTTYNTTTEIVWSNGSAIRSLPATQKAGRSFTASLVIMDEAAYLQWAEALYTSVKPTIDGGGQLIVLSTANGVGNLFHNLWTRASSGLNAFKTIFLAWWERPGRDREWYDARIREESDPNRVKQEYPATATEAFRVSGRLRFDPDWVDRQAVNVREHGIPKEQWPPALRSIPNLTIYGMPRPNRPCVIGADVAEGLEHGDYSDAAVLDAQTWEELAVLNGHWEPDTYATYLHALSDAYGATIVVERNNHGHAVLATLKLRGCLNVGIGHDGRLGWLTNVQTKPQSIDLLAVALRDNLLKIHSQAALDEMKTYRVDDDGTTSAPSGYFDDRVMSRAIALIYGRFAAVPAVMSTTSNPLAHRRWGT